MYKALHRETSHSPDRAKVMDDLLAAEAPKMFKTDTCEVEAAEVLGVWVSQWSEWDGETIIKVALEALEDANFSTFSEMLGNLWATYKVALQEDEADQLEETT